jgi:hypothetical protein
MKKIILFLTILFIIAGCASPDQRLEMAESVSKNDVLLYRTAGEHAGEVELFTFFDTISGNLNVVKVIPSGFISSISNIDLPCN